MPTDLQQQVARRAEEIDREAPAISLDEILGRGTITVDKDLLAPPRTREQDASLFGGLWGDARFAHGNNGEPSASLVVAPTSTEPPARRRVAMRVALVAAAATVLVVALASIVRTGGETDPADVPSTTVPTPSTVSTTVDFPDLTTTFVSPRNGFAIDHPERASVAPADQLWGLGEQDVGWFDVLETDAVTAFRSASARFPGDLPCTNTEAEPIPCGSIDEQVDRLLAADLPGSCGVPRSQQAEFEIDAQPGRIAECPNHVEATVVFGGRLYLFVLTHDRSDARAVFDAFMATVDLTPETAVDYPGMTETFVSPTYGYSSDYWPRGGDRPEPASQLWDPDDQTVEDIDFDARFDAQETGLGAYFEAASTDLPDGVSVDEWVDDYVTSRSAGGCGVPRSEQEEISIDGQPGRKAECDHSEATVVAGGRLYLFLGPNDDRDWFDGWIATIDLTPETAVQLPALTSTFVSPTYGYTFDYLDRNGLQTAAKAWDPASGRIDANDINDQFDTVETGLNAQFGAASTPIPEGVSIDEWVDEYATPEGWACGVPRSQQEEVAIDGQTGRITECPDTADSAGAIQATVIAGERLYYFALWHMRPDAREWFDAWIATIDLTPETAAVP